jgi:hypothetical protein
MRLYKYRDFSEQPDVAIRRVEEILRTCCFWCARPEDLNDKDELVWSIDFTPTARTASLLAKRFIEQGRNCNHAYLAGMWAVHQRLDVLEKHGQSALQALIAQGRSEIGILCFATDASDHALMWDRYGGSHCGICIELDVPDSLIGNHLYWVDYKNSKQVHIDQLLDTSTDSAKSVYEVALLTKGISWKPEAEIRFVSKAQNHPVWIEGSKITGINFGGKLPEPTKNHILQYVDTISEKTL